jgi:hypothetical protein
MQQFAPRQRARIYKGTALILRGVAQACALPYMARQS